MDFITAEIENFEDVMRFYYDLTDAMRNAEFHPGWKRDIYPSRQFVLQAIEQGEMTAALADGEIVGAMILNHDCNDGYSEAEWKTAALRDEVVVIHALGISPRRQGKGDAKKMVAYAIEACRQKGMKSIRLDVLASNIPAQKLYSGMGFACVGTVPLFYEDTGLTTFLLYELPL